jgi:NAD(P)-dependent dehydrogenase (short-subunit alcohol dehydrogenase family)
MSTLHFDGDVIIVTGAGRGMGRAHALELADRGARVIVNDVENAAEVAREILAKGGTAVANQDSVATPEGGAALVDAALSTWERLDAVVTNATIVRHLPFDEMTLDDFDAVISTKLRAGYFVLHPAYKWMKAVGSGRIVAVTSLSGLLGAHHQANYAAANAGLLGLIRSLALEGAVHGIQANLLNPGALNARTDAWLDAITTVDAAKVRANFLPERVSPMVTVLAHRSCPCTGQVMSAWGGAFARATVTLNRGWVSEAPPTAEDVLAHWSTITDDTSAEDPGLDAMAFGAGNFERLYGA